MPQLMNVTNEFIALTGYCLTHASYVLNMHGKRRRVSKKTAIQADVRKTGLRGRKKKYTEEQSPGFVEIDPGAIYEAAFMINLQSGHLNCFIKIFL